ncbi:MAG: diguanylate cyclase [Actinomycetota bacterium]|nr:diguanylate cyclase [Actinomycetota bacterium]
MDDDTARAARIGQVLSLHGYGVLHACSGHAAVDLAHEHRPPLVLLSVTTARGDHADLCRQLQSDWRCGSPSIIILAGRADAAEFASGLATTADDYVILEPFDAVRVLTRVAATLRRAEEMRASSPLTGLPGNTAIETELQRRTSAGDPMALLYIDLDNFKAYNDHYGFLRGDAVLRGVAEVLRAAAEKRPGTFLGHVGGDDFVVVSTPEDAEDIANEITAGVDEQAPLFYDPEDVDRGGIEVMDRRGVPHYYPFVTVSIGVALTQEGQVGDHRALVDVATEMKQYAKTLPGSVAAVDRRADDDRGVGQHQALPRANPVARLSPGRLPGRPHRQSRMRRMTTLVSTLLLLPFALMIVPAVAASAAPGDTLYQAKLSLESMRLALATNPVRDVGLHLDFASDRLGELTVLLDASNPDSGLIEIVSENFQGHVVKAHQGLRVLKARGDAEGPRAANLRTKVVSTAALSETVRLQCGQPETPVAAAQACLEMQPALTTVHEFPELVVPDPQERILIALPPPPGPPNSATSNTSTATTGQAPSSSQPVAESDTTASTAPPAGGDKPAPKGDQPAASGGDKQARSGGNDPAGSSGEAPADPSQPPAETAASPNPEPTPEPTPSPSETGTPTENPPPPGTDQQRQAGPPSPPPGQGERPANSAPPEPSGAPEPPDPTPDPEAE